MLDSQHAIFMLLFDGKLAFAPIDKIALHNVLDIATGAFPSSTYADPPLTAEQALGYGPLNLVNELANALSRV